MRNDLGSESLTTFREGSNFKYGKKDQKPEMPMFHKADKYYRRQLEMLKEEYPASFEVVEDFVEDLIAEGISKHRIYSYILWTRKCLKAVDKKIDEWDRKDVRRTLNHYKEEHDTGKITENSMLEVKKTLKKVFKWMGKEELVNWFTVGKTETKVTPQDLITEEEFNKMIENCMNSRDRALISLLYESGARIGEIGSMRVKDISFDDYGTLIWLPKSKTATRKVRVVYSTNYLSQWLCDHPLKHEIEKPLWVKLTGSNAYRRMEYADISAQIKKIAGRAGIKKRIYPHLFRHTRATKLLSKVSESIGSKYMGWVNGSNMVGVYVHLANEDVDEAILKMHGIKSKGTKDLEVRQCPRCTQINPGTNYCTRCGLPLTQETAQEVEEWEKRKTEALNQLSDPETLKLMMGMQQEIKELKTKIKEIKQE